jgi:hypothetical protein
MYIGVTRVSIAMMNLMKKTVNTNVTTAPNFDVQTHPLPATLITDSALRNGRSVTGTKIALIRATKPIALDSAAGMTTTDAKMVWIGTRVVHVSWNIIGVMVLLIAQILAMRLTVT